MNGVFRRIAPVCAAAALLVPMRANHSWGGYHWARQENPFALDVGNNVTTNDWYTALLNAANDWRASSVLDTWLVDGNANPRTCKPTSGRVEVCNSSYGNNGWLGIAQIWATGGHITQGVVKLNDTYFKTARYNTPAWRALVTCQEVGHTLGLDHQDENFSNANLGTCMDYTNDPSTNQHPNDHDYAQLVTIYSHVDNTTTVGASSATSRSDVGDGPGAWGRLVSSTKNGRGETYELDLGNGNKVITHVTWVEGRERGRE